MNLLLLLPILVFTWLLFAAITSGVVSAAYPGLVGPICRIEPGKRAWLLRGLILAPILFGAILTMASIAPSLVTCFVGATDFCPFHCHYYLCPFHVSDHAEPGNVTSWLVLTGIMLFLLVRTIRPIRSIYTAIREISQLTRSGRAYRESGMIEVASEYPLAFTTGLRESVIVVASRLTEALSPASLNAVMAHEAAHRERRDPLWKAVCSVAGVFYPFGVKSRLLAEHDLACENACDRQASAVVGSGALVAKAILDVLRLSPHASEPSPVSAGFAESHIERRLEALVGNAPADSDLPRWLWLPVAASAAALVFYADTLHHFADTVFQLFLR
jgi:Zn-dependent protease with chaperone function